MQQKPGSEVSSTSVPRLRQPTLLVEWPAGHRVFAENLCDLFCYPETPEPSLTSRQVPFWPDVFVERPVAWRSMASSALYHLFAIVVVYGMSVTYAPRAPIHTRSPFDGSKITYYSVSEYLPAIDTGSAPAPAQEERKGEPKWAKQRIISLPPAPDNFRQTIITPSQIKLPKDVSMPNLVAWTPVPTPVPEAAIKSAPKLPPLTPEVVAPAPSAEALRSKAAAAWQPEVVAPPPSMETARSKTRLPNIPEPSVIEPPVSSSAAARPLGAMNVTRLDPTVAAPKLPVPEQRTATAGSAGAGNVAPNGTGGAAVQPAPDVGGIGNGKRAAGQLIALGLDPATVNGPIDVPNGSRYGRFAATPEGNPNAPGTPDIKGGGTNSGTGHGSNGGGGNGGGSGPPGISVGPGASKPVAGGVVAQGDPLDVLKSNASAPKPTTMASLAKPRLADIPHASRNAPALDAPSKIEEKVFGGKRFYSMTLNMPNLTSAGGSWIIRFAELKESTSKGDVVAPQARVKVDPSYPAELMRDRVEGTVTLYAVIHKDGTVGEVKVLRGVEESLDESARVALARWKFYPAMKNGTAVDLEAVVQIPFAVKKMPF
ncbi:MAG: TonB family protein [Acidobacteriia bacterium]|nr:TonB family protein [Terriglobia bacterium]